MTNVVPLIPPGDAWEIEDDARLEAIAEADAWAQAVRVEAARELTDYIIAISKQLPIEQQVRHLAKMRTELIQVAAVAVAWVEALNKLGVKS